MGAHSGGGAQGLGRGESVVLHLDERDARDRRIGIARAQRPRHAEIGAGVAGAGDQDRAFRAGQHERPGERRVARALRLEHRRDRGRRNLAAVALVDLAREQRARGLGVGSIEVECAAQRVVAFGTGRCAGAAKLRRREIARDERQLRGERRVGDRPVQLPRAPVLLESDRLAETGGVPRPLAQVSRERLPLARVEHLPHERGPSAAGREALHDPGLQAVVVGVVVLLAEQYEARRSNPLDHRLRRDALAGGHVEQNAHERMVGRERRAPRRADRCARRAATRGAERGREKRSAPVRAARYCRLGRGWTRH